MHKKNKEANFIKATEVIEPKSHEESFTNDVKHLLGEGVELLSFR
jgi:hypothetical protein